MGIYEAILIVIFFVVVVAAWRWCLKKPEKCIDWRSEQERRQIQEPILFPCRRKKQRRED